MAKLVKCVNWLSSGAWAEMLTVREAVAKLNELGSSAYQELKKVENAEIHHAVYGVKFYDEKWNLVKVNFYYSCFKSEKEYEEIASATEINGFKNFTIQAYHR